MIALHVAAALLSLAVGGLVLRLAKGTRLHKALGRAWVGLMLAAILSSFWIFEIRDGAGPSFVHLFSVGTTATLGCAILAIRRGNVRAHRRYMIGTYVGLVLTGLAALAPGRLLYFLLFA